MPAPPRGRRAFAGSKGMNACSTPRSGTPNESALPLSRGPQLTHDIRCGLAGFVAATRWKGDGAYPRVPASAIALADLGQVDHILFVGPGVGTDRHFYTKAAAAQPHTVDCVRIQIVRNELVVAFEVMIGDIKIDRALFVVRSLAENINRAAVALQKRAQQGCDEWLFDQPAHRLVRQSRNERRQKPVVIGRFD